MSYHSIKKGLIVFIKNPVKGKAKTRIARTVGEDKALTIYRALLGYTRKLAQQFSDTKYLYYNEAIMEDEWSPDEFQKRVQTQGDLGLKMADALREVLSEVDTAVLIGSDCAQLKISHIEYAFEVLKQKDVVIGPSLDGGYYLIGMKKCHQSLFTDIEWSTDNVLSHTLEKIDSKGLSYGLLEPLSDIDEWEDWVKYGWEL